MDWTQVIQWAEGIALNPINYPILGVTWVIIELMDPLVRWLIDGAKQASARVRLYQLAGIGKRFAAVFWCSLFVWVPLAQPELCQEAVTKVCQTLMERLSVGAVLGFALTGGHAVGAALYRKAVKEKKKRKIICANCKSTALVFSLSDPCPICGQPPHEVTRT